MSEIILPEYNLAVKVASYDVDSADRIRLSAVLRYQIGRASCRERVY